MLLVGNKCDEEAGKRQVSTKTGEALEVQFVANKMGHPILGYPVFTKETNATAWA